MINRRKALIQEISELRNSRVICYVGGDRQNVGIRVAPDIIPIFHKQLEQIGENEKIDLFLFTKGGDVHTALRLVELIYEYTDNFSVLIPYKAYSAGTLISLGASEIMMSKMGELSPVDPNVTSAFNPSESGNPGIKVPISVEDVYSFFTIAKDIMEIKDDKSLAKVLADLTDNVHPLAIGSVYRTHALIRSIAKKLLLTHMDISQEYRMNEIVDNLTEKLYSHSYMISRKEAKEAIKLPVTYCNKILENKIWSLYEEYEKDLKLLEAFVPELEADSNGRFSVCSGIIENSLMTHGYVFEGLIEKLNPNDVNSSLNVNILSQGWRNLEGRYYE